MTNEQLEEMAAEIREGDLYTDVEFWEWAAPSIILDGTIEDAIQAQQLVEFLTAAYNLGE